jgi:hypothetical protein
VGLHLLEEEVHLEVVEDQGKTAALDDCGYLPHQLLNAKFLIFGVVLLLIDVEVHSPAGLFRLALLACLPPV